MEDGECSAQDFRTSKFIDCNLQTQGCIIVCPDSAKE